MLILAMVVLAVCLTHNKCPVDVDINCQNPCKESLKIGTNEFMMIEIRRMVTRVRRLARKEVEGASCRARYVPAGKY